MEDAVGVALGAGVVGLLVCVGVSVGCGVGIVDGLGVAVRSGVLVLPGVGVRVCCGEGVLVWAWVGLALGVAEVTRGPGVGEGRSVGRAVGGGGTVGSVGPVMAVGWATGEGTAVAVAPTGRVAGTAVALSGGAVEAAAVGEGLTSGVRRSRTTSSTISGSNGAKRISRGSAL